MKRLIAILSSMLGAACIYALANAEDAAQTPKTSPDTVFQVPQTDGEEQSRGEPGTIEVPGQTQEQADEDTAWNPDRICKDRDGFIYREGQAGFSRCQAERGQSAEGAGNQAGQVGSETKSPTENQTGVEDQPGVVERGDTEATEPGQPGMQEPTVSEPTAPGNQGSAGP